MGGELLSIPPERLGEGTDVSFFIVSDEEMLYRHFAEAMVEKISGDVSSGRRTNFILPVGPVGQYAIFVELVRERGIDLSGLTLFFMDEYLTDDDRYIPAEHPLSFRGFVRRSFSEFFTADVGFSEARIFFPDPENPASYEKHIEKHGGIDICFAGVGINGHLAFNEPPDEGDEISVEDFLSLPTRVLSLSRETKTINSVTAAGGAIEYIPRRAVTVGMKEIFASRRLMVYMNRSWQRAVVRRMLHGEMTAHFPASLVRMHPDVSVIVTDEVARSPLPKLR
jgi:glucosamine-6-phosphate deaminase